MNKSEHIVWHTTNVKRSDREKSMQQNGAVLWFTGLSGSGKSTVANALEQRLHSLGKVTYLLDGDNVRHGLNSDLGFSVADRQENMRRIAQVSKLFWDANLITLVSFISPFRHERRLARDLMGKDFIEIFVNTPLEICEQRDPKGLYVKARKGEIADFTGLTSPYEAPENPEITLYTERESLDESSDKILLYLKNQGHI